MPTMQRFIEFEAYIAGIKFDEVNNDVVAEVGKRITRFPLA